MMPAPPFEIYSLLHICHTWLCLSMGGEIHSHGIYTKLRTSVHINPTSGLPKQVTIANPEVVKGSTRES